MVARASAAQRGRIATGGRGFVETETMTACFCYVTAGSKGEALRVGRALVEEQLAACANVLDGMTSVYWWQGALEQADEAMLIVKTRAELVDRLTARVRELHSYDCPCVLSLPIMGGNPDYLAWIAAEAQPDRG
jgi:periplasmic divalent cation tolerance protein